MALDFVREICKIIFAATDEERGCMAMGTKLHPKTKIEGGLLADEAAELIQDFLRTGGGKRFNRLFFDC